MQAKGGFMENIVISKYFEADHDRLDQLFKDFQAFKRVDYSRAKEYFVAFKHGLQRHIVWEEDILFPLFEKKTGMTTGGPTFVMRIEHRQIAECLESVHKKVKAADPNSDEEEKGLISVLAIHNEKEEQILYPAIDQAVTDTDKEDVFDAMKKIPDERYLVCCQNA
jgi:regulator of cell morphogenesis and NO signaling